MSHAGFLVATVRLHPTFHLHVKKNRNFSLSDSEKVLYIYRSNILNGLSGKIVGCFYSMVGWVWGRTRTALNKKKFLMAPLILY